MLTLAEVASNPQILTSLLRSKNYEELTFRPLRFNDSQSLFDFLGNLSTETRHFYTLDGYGLQTAKELCDSIGKYDKLRFIVESKDNKIIGLFEFSFDLTEDDKERFSKYGYTLNQGSDCRFGPCLSDNYQNQGLGTVILPLIIKIAKDFNQKRIILWGGVLADNTKAIQYYRKNNFKVVGNFINNNNIARIDMILDINCLR